tara:strand:- start:508 stop:3951 length:3444 start_codon:yes stop_codon:yes gene_type:complete
MPQTNLERRKMQLGMISQPQIDQPQNFENEVFDWLPNFIKEGYNESITGMARELSIGKKPFDIENYEPKVYEDIGSSVVSLFMPADFALMAAGGGVGGFALRTAAKRAGTMATKQLLRSGVSKKTTRTIVQGGLQRVVSGATGFGSYSGVASALSQQIQNSDVDYGDVLTESMKGSLLGAVTGGIAARGIAKGSSTAVKVLQEGAAFGTLSPALEGEFPTPQDYIHSVGTIMGLRGTNAAFYLANKKRKGLITEKRRKKLEPLAERLASEDVKAQIGIETKSDLYQNKNNANDVVSIVSVTQKDNVTRFNLKDKDGKKSSLRKDLFYKKYTTSESKDLLLEKYNLYEAESGYNSNDIQLRRKEAIKRVDGKEPKQDVRLKDMTNTQLSEYGKIISTDYRIREMKKRYLDLADLPQKSFLEHVLPPKMVQFILPANRRGKLLESRVFLENIEKTDLATRRTFERYQNKITSNFSKLGDKDLRKISNSLEGKERLNKDLEIKVNEARKIFDEMYEYARSKGIKVADYRSDYFPQMIKRSISDIISNDFMSMAGKRAQLLEGGLSADTIKELNTFIRQRVNTEFSKESKSVMRHLVNKEGMTYYEAYKQLQNELFVQQLSPFGNLEKARKFKLPEEILERDVLKVMTSYNMKLARRVEIASKFGSKGERAENLLKQIAEKNTSEARAMSNVWQSFTGFIESDPAKNYSPTGKKVFENIMAFEMGTKIALGTATIPNLSQFAISTALEAGYFRTFKGAMRLLNPDVRKKLKASGVTYHNALDVLLGTDFNIRSADGIKRSLKEVIKNPKDSLLNIASGLASLSGFKRVNYLNNLVAASTAEIYIKDLHKIANSSSIKSRRSWAVKNLKRFDIDPNKNISSEALSSGMFKFARDSQLQKNILSDPIFFNNPKWRPWIIFKRFGYKQANYLAETMGRELKAGNAFALLRLGIGGVAGGAAVSKMREMYIKYLTDQETFNEDKEGLAFIADNMLSVGAFGVFGDILGAEDLVSTIKFTVTPVMLSDLDKVTDGLVALQKNIDTFGIGEIAMRRSIKPVASVFGTIPSRALSKLQTPAQKIDTLKQRKSKLKSKLLDLLIEGKSALVIKNIKQWNSKFPEVPITGDDINFKVAYARIARKNQKIAREKSMLKMEK